MGQYQILHDEFDIHEAAAGVLQAGFLRRMRFQHPFAHGQHLVTQGGDVARRGQDVKAGLLEAVADLAVTGAEARPGQRLVLPQPGLVGLVAGKGFD